MSVNTMSVQDARVLLNSLHTQVTGQRGIEPTSTAEFVSMATTTLQAGTDPVFNALMQTLSKTIVAVRPYASKFKGLELSNIEWGAVIRKISFADREIAEDSKAFGTQIDGQAVDMYTIRKPDVLEMRFYGSDVYEDYFTTYKEQLKLAFENEGAFGSFVTGLTQHMANVWEQYAEDMKRTTLINFIGAKNALDNGVIHVLTEYNNETGLNLTAQDIYKPDNIGNFFRWLRARVNTISREFGERSQKYQVKVQGKNINRHTDAENLRIYMLAPVLDKIDAMVNTTTYHNEPLAYADVEGVSFWQAIENPDEISVTPCYTASNGTVATAEAQTMKKVIGVIFDRDAMGVNFYLNEIQTTPLNARGLYWNTFMHRRTQYFNDLTEKGAVLILD